MATVNTSDRSILDMKRTQYATEWQHEWEQLTARIQPLTTILNNSPKGSYWEFPKMGTVEVHEYTGSFKEITWDAPTLSNAGMHYRKFYSAIPISVDEVDDLLNLDYTMATMMKKQKTAANRFIDMITLGVTKDNNSGEIIVKADSSNEGFSGGILGKSYSGIGGTTAKDLDYSYASFKKGQGALIPVDYSIDGTGVSTNFQGTLLDRFGYALRRLEENEAFNGQAPGDLCIAISPAVKQQLNALEIMLNKGDYGFSSLVDGVPTFNKRLNATIVVTNLLPKMNTETKDGTAVNGARMCCAWLKSQIGFGLWKDSEFSIKTINNYVDVDNYCRVRGKAGCARMRDDAVFILPCIES